MTFAETVSLLSEYHDRIWFYSEGPIWEPWFCYQWSKGMICTAGKRPLAMQAGHPDQWQLTPSFKELDSPLSFDDCDDGTEITLNFKSLVDRHMPGCVYSVIELHGGFFRIDQELDTKLDLFSRLNREGFQTLNRSMKLKSGQ